MAENHDARSRRQTVIFEELPSGGFSRAIWLEYANRQTFKGDESGEFPREVGLFLSYPPEDVLLTPAEVAPGDLNAYAAIAVGCPAMGAEVLEEMEFQPMFDACKRSLGGKRVALFGSYGWGDGEWMRTWESDCDSAGVNLVCESVICTETPDDAALEACRALGKALVE